jgi:hypothetical protein
MSTLSRVLIALSLVIVLPAAIYAALDPAAPAPQPGSLRVEDLGPMSYRANVQLGPLAPDPAGTGFVQLLFSFSGDSATTTKPFEIVAVDLQTGQVTRTAASTQAGSVGFQVQRWVWGRDGKLYIGTYGPPHLICWDPKTQTAKDIGWVWQSKYDSVIFSMAVGTDGAIYGGSALNAKACRYDPKTAQLEDLGVQGLPRENTGAYAYSIGADDRYVYTASGKIPWYVVAYDRQTRTQRNLLTYNQHDFPEIFQYPNEVYARTLIRTPAGQEIRREFYRLADGKALPATSLPTTPAAVTPLPSRPVPEVVLDISPVSDTRAARLWYRSPAGRTATPGSVPSGVTPEQLGWRSVSVPVTSQPHSVARLATLPDGRLVGATWRYGDLFVFDPATDRRTTLGPPTGANIYSLLVTGGKLYYSGYPNAPLGVYDPAQPWTAARDTPLAKAPDVTSPLSNPRRLLELGISYSVHYGYYLAQDAAGLIYIGAHADRRRVGGALVIYDPRVGAVRGIGEPKLVNYDVAGLAATADGRRIVYSSKVVTDPQRPNDTPSAAKLFVYDPKSWEFVAEWVPFPDRKNTGLIATGAPGQVVGAAPNGSNTTLYAIDVASGRIVYQWEVPGSVGGSFRTGPDGLIWTFVGDSLVRIRPETGQVLPVAKVTSGPGDIGFVGRDVYLAGTESLRRIRGAVPAWR